MTYLKYRKQWQKAAADEFGKVGNVLVTRIACWCSVNAHIFHLICRMPIYISINNSALSLKLPSSIKPKQPFTTHKTHNGFMRLMIWTGKEICIFSFFTTITNCLLHHQYTPSCVLLGIFYIPARLHQWMLTH